VEYGSNEFGAGQKDWNLFFGIISTKDYLYYLLQFYETHYFINSGYVPDIIGIQSNGTNQR
jgi:hypothetical protein